MPLSPQQKTNLDEKLRECENNIRGVAHTLIKQLEHTELEESFRSKMLKKMDSIKEEALMEATSITKSQEEKFQNAEDVLEQTDEHLELLKENATSALSILFVAVITFHAS